MGIAEILLTNVNSLLPQVPRGPQRSSQMIIRRILYKYRPNVHHWPEHKLFQGNVDISSMKKR